MEKDLKLIFWLHLIVIFLIWLSPFLVSWKIILIGIGLYYLQLIIIGDCILTRKQFNTSTRKITFYYYYLNRLGFKFNPDKVRFAADYVMPWVILGISLIWQIAFRQKILL